MKSPVLDASNVWLISSPRTGESWYVKCPSRSGAKIFLTAHPENLGMGVSTSAGPFFSEPVALESVPEGELLEARFPDPAAANERDKRIAAEKRAEREKARAK